MKRFVQTLAVLALLFLAACAPQAPLAAPESPPPAPEPAALPLPPPPEPASTALEVLPGAKIIPSTQKLYGITVDDGVARSAYGKRAGSEFQLDMKLGDVLKVSVSYNEPVIVLKGGGIEQEVKPGENVRLELKETGHIELAVLVDGRQTDLLALTVAALEAPPAE